MLRGCGLDGFLGMRMRQTHTLLPEKYIYRPLLSHTKAYIQSQCDHWHIPYMIDSSNSDTRTSKRNKLRNDILPDLIKLSHQHTRDGNTFAESMKHIYESLEEKFPYFSIENSATPIFLPTARNADRGYRIILARSDFTSTHLHDILSYL